MNREEREQLLATARLFLPPSGAGGARRYHPSTLAESVVRLHEALEASERESAALRADVEAGLKVTASLRAERDKRREDCVALQEQLEAAWAERSKLRESLEEALDERAAARREVAQAEEMCRLATERVEAADQLVRELLAHHDLGCVRGAAVACTHATCTHKAVRAARDAVAKKGA